jgi:ubiquinone/menaquinone biosynthesis C-methylase UbiE
MFPLITKDNKNWWRKWDNSARTFDFMNRGIELRYGGKKREWFSRASGRILLVAVGTGLDLEYFEPGQKVVGIDISGKMLEKAREKRDRCKADVELVRADVQVLGFAGSSFDTVVTSCTFCSVPDPVKGLEEIRRVMKPGGRLLMFEHVRSGIFWMGPMMDVLTLLSRRFGPDLNRKTRDNIRRAGFRLTREVNVYLDIVKLFEAVKPT